MLPHIQKTAAGLALVASRALIAALIFILILAALASAQDPVQVPPGSKALPVDHVPSWVLYWAVVISGVLGAGLVKAIHYLWGRLTATTESGSVALEKLNTKLQELQTAHTTAVERLKQESANFGREAVTQLAVSTEAIDDLTAVTNQLLAELHKNKGTA